MTETATAPDPILDHQFDDLEQQHDATVLGMWAFLATEVMFFGGLITAFITYRTMAPQAFEEASRHLDVTLGGINTAVLLCSSLTMALAVNEAQRGQRRRVVLFLVLTMILGASFLGIKAVEYYHEYEHHLVPALNFSYTGADAGHVELYFVLYFFMTGLHAIHLIIGIVLVGIIAVLVERQWFSGSGALPVEVTGLYWHFIDIVWVFLYPLLYLIDVHK
ncbi:MAG TPA: cytochrome c oxidase subunit 3 [Isosphaeraceae bacterium]|nr:cytochrome c oxidase subunit 3 [Isosphaeraceae bacterium]